LIHCATPSVLEVEQQERLFAAVHARQRVLDDDGERAAPEDEFRLTAVAAN
jgi:hypothetical protein